MIVCFDDKPSTSNSYAREYPAIWGMEFESEIKIFPLLFALSAFEKSYSSTLIVASSEISLEVSFLDLTVNVPSNTSDLIVPVPVTSATVSVSF